MTERDAATDDRQERPAGVTWWEPGFRARAVFDVVFIGLALAYLVTAVDLGIGLRGGQVESGTFPLFAVSVLLVCLVVDLVKLVAGGALRTGGGQGRIPLSVWLILVGIAVYLVLLEVVGHALLGSAIYAALLLLLGRRKWWVALLAGLAAGFGTDFLFTALLGLDMPSGILEIGVEEWI